MDNKKLAARLIIAGIKAGKIDTAKRLDYAKKKASKHFKLGGTLRNSDILEFAKDEEKEELAILVKKPVRTVSGVAIVAVMCKPGECPGKCIFCPTASEAPKSYTGFEPAAMRAKNNEFDPYEQAKDRLKQLTAIGHETDKVELIIMGGTFPSFSKKYKEHFVKRLFDALNGEESETLEEAQEKNETAKHRSVGLTIETRPDYATREHIEEFLRLGATRVELGVQTCSDEIYEKVGRGHTLADVVSATQNLKDAGYKVCYHYMPGLLLSGDEDVEMFNTMFSDSRFCPDMLKIYPTLIIDGTKLSEMWKKGEYKPYTNDEAANVIAKMKSLVPEWTRIMRVQRDIPAPKIVAGVTASNLRELAEKKMKEFGLECKCIRCREAGHRGHADGEPKLVKRMYNTNGGWEMFISYETKNTLFGYVRVRIPENSWREEIKNDSAIVRELKIVGTSIALGEHGKGIQHKGFGKKLMEEAEKEAREAGKNSVVVISAIGTREYYRNLGYTRAGPYMKKTL